MREKKTPATHQHTHNVVPTWQIIIIIVAFSSCLLVLYGLDFFLRIVVFFQATDAPKTSSPYDP